MNTCCILIILLSEDNKALLHYEIVHSTLLA